MCSSLGRPTPVSYTHLDVYKRQILCKEQYAKAIDKAIFPGTQGGPLMHVIAGKAVCLGEALKPEFKDYGRRVVENAKALSEGLLKRRCV